MSAKAGDWIEGDNDVKDRRRAARYDVEVQGIIRGEGGVECVVPISSLSVEGCRLTVAERRLAAGTLLSIAVGPVGLLHARVAWRVGAIHGVSFDQPLHPTVLDHIRLFLSSEPALIEELRSA